MGMEDGLYRRLIEQTIHEGVEKIKGIHVAFFWLSSTMVTNNASYLREKSAKKCCSCL